MLSCDNIVRFVVLFSTLTTIHTIDANFFQSAAREDPGICCRYQTT